MYRLLCVSSLVGCHYNPIPNRVLFNIYLSTKLIHNIIHMSMA